MLQISHTPYLGGMMELEAENGKKTILSGAQSGGDSHCANLLNPKEYCQYNGFTLDKKAQH